MSERTAIFAGTFDPVTNGHLDIIRRGAALYDRLVVSVARAGRNTVFNIEDRIAFVRDAVAHLENVSVEPFEGLVVEHAKANGARVLLRGVRGAKDLDYEMQMAYANRDLDPEIETVLLPSSPAVSLVSASLVREVASLGGDVSAWVPASVVEAFASKG